MVERGYQYKKMAKDEEIVNSDKPEDEYIDSPKRRDFMTAVIGGAAALYGTGIGYIILRYLSTGVEVAQDTATLNVKVDNAADLANNSATMFQFGVKPGLLIKDEAGELHAYSAVCKHLGCTVAYQPEQKRIFCACHSGVYDYKTGKNIAGPPPEPLDVLKVNKAKDGIYITKS